MDWTNLYKKYAGLWVTLKEDEQSVISSSDSAEKALQEAQSMGYESPIILRIPKKVTYFVGSLWISNINK